MTPVETALARLRLGHDAAFAARVERYVREGSPEPLAGLEPPEGDSTWSDAVRLALPAPGNLGEAERRLLRVLVAGGARRALGEWASLELAREQPGEDRFATVRGALEDAGAGAAFLAGLTAEFVTPLDADAGPGSAGRYLLALPAHELEAAVEAAIYHEGVARALGLLARRGGEGAHQLIARKLLALPAAQLGELVARALAAGGVPLRRTLARVLAERRDADPRMRLALAQLLFPDDTPAGDERSAILEIGRALLEANEAPDAAGSRFLLSHVGRELLPSILSLLERTAGVAGGNRRVHLVAATVAELGHEGLPVLACAADPRHGELALHALDILADALPQAPSPELLRVITRVLEPLAGDRFRAAALRVLEAAGAPYVESVLPAWRRLDPAGWPAASVGLRLAELDGSLLGEVREAARRFLRESDHELPADDALLLARLYGHDLVPEAQAFLSRHPDQKSRRTLLHALVTELRREAAPAILALLARGDAESREAALSHLLRLPDLPRATLLAAMRSALADPDARAVARALRLVARQPLPELAAELWALLQHDRVELRAAAVEALAALAALGGAVRARARPLAASGRDGGVRAAAIALLAREAAPEDLRLFQRRLLEEADAEARDALWSALARHPWPFPDPLVTAEMLDRFVAAAGRGKRPAPPSWVPEEKLPELRWSGGAALSRAEARYLVERAVRRKEVERDPELAVLAGRLEPDSSAAFALTLLEAYLGGGADGRHRWALALAATLGDRRAVAPLLDGVKAAAEAGRVKAAENLVDALALLDAPEALAALDGLARSAHGRLRRAGAAAAAAFERVAVARGLSVDELGDEVVPWLGFGTDGRRTVEDRVEVLPAMDFTLVFRDLATGTRSARPPKGLSREAQVELKGTAKALREAGKVQVTRMEAALVDERRWPVTRWRELFLANPVLLPFAVRLVWGSWEGSTILATFRALPDRTLTTLGDEELALDEGHPVGLVHPALLGQGEVRAWQAHLAAHEVEPPFEQLARPAAAPPEEERAADAVRELEGRNAGAYALLHRAERLGWALEEAGRDGVMAFTRRFPSSDTVAELEVEWAFGGGARDEMTLGPLRFRRASGGAALALGEVPRLAYAEAVGNLRLFAGG